LGLAALVTLVAVTSDADARSRRRHHSRPSYNPPYADIVIDAKTGAVLHEASADAHRYPASLTKIMTLYLLFEQLEAGTITMQTPMKVSAEAASQAPTKLGLDPGDTLKVEDAIKGLVTKSANDAAVVIAEALGGSEAEFARMMTRKARAIGMRNTTYDNASGLPDDAQVTSARDQALLGIVIQERFPKFYHYFSLERFVYHGHAMRNHNHLLGKVDGVDGIKTGYTRASGFNLITSVRRGARHIVAVVMGGRSARSRDARMRELIEAYIGKASTRPKPAPVASAPVPLPLPEPPVAAASVADADTPLPGSSEPITPLKVKTVTVKVVLPKPATATAATEARAVMPMPTSTSTPPTAEVPVLHTDSTPALSFAAREKVPEHAVRPPSSPRPGVLGTLPAMMAAAQQSIAKEVAVTPAKAEPAPLPRAPTVRGGGWAIQVGAYDDESEARQHLKSAREKAARALQKAEAYVERTVKGAKTYYRARFAGFDRTQAETLCKRLKRQDVVCMATRI
jgi:D-alanyl-D-alanine carboxypeptidase